MQRERYEQWFPGDVGGMLDSINSVTGLNLSLVGSDGVIVGYLEDDPPKTMPEAGTTELWAGIKYAGVVFATQAEATAFVRGAFFGVFRGPHREGFVAFFKGLSERNVTYIEARERALFEWISGEIGGE